MHMEDLMLYYHIPFCVSKCAYCSFYSIPKADEALKEQYTKALIRQTKGFCDSNNYSVRSVYFGGGTPTVLGAKRIARVLNTAFEVFDLAPDAEITVEVNPCTVDRQGLSILRESGVNRLSIGAQSFNNKTLRLLNRAHSAEDFISCYRMARSVGFSNISADLIFAFPQESNEELLFSVKQLISLEPEHISVYSLSLEEGTTLYNNRTLYRFPNEDEEEAQYELLCQSLAEAGYEHYEISNFSKPGYASRHNSGYWKRTPYFGFGAGAHSFFDNRRFETERDLHAFIKETHGPCTAPTTYSIASPITADEAEEERIMLGLRLSSGVEIKKPVPKYLIDTGLVKCSGNTVCLTEKGFRLSNSIIGMLI